MMMRLQLHLDPQALELFLENHASKKEYHLYLIIPFSQQFKSVSWYIIQF